MIRNRKNEYLVSLDISEEEENRIKRFVAAIGYKSVRDFVKKSIQAQMDYDLQLLPVEDRKAVETVMGNLIHGVEG